MPILFDPKIHKKAQLYELRRKKKGNVYITVLVKSKATLDQVKATPWLYFFKGT